MLFGLGAYTYSDYRQDQIDEKELALQKKAMESELADMDVVIDLVGGEVTAKSLNVLKPDGILVQLVPSPEPIAELAEERGVRAMYMTASADGDQLRKLTSLVENGILKTHVGQVFPLSDVASAQNLSEQGQSFGKIVIDCEA